MHHRTREEIERGSTAHCRLCKGTPIPENFGSSRKCAWDADGNFTKDNWNCVTEGKLRGFAFDNADVQDSYGFCRWYEDQGYGSILVPSHPQDTPDGNRLGYFRGGGFISMTWYKRRGSIDCMVRVDSYDSEKHQTVPKLLTLLEAEAAIDNLFAAGLLELTPEEISALGGLAAPEGMEESNNS